MLEHKNPFLPRVEKDNASLEFETREEQNDVAIKAQLGKGIEGLFQEFRSGKEMIRFDEFYAGIKEENRPFLFDAFGDFIQGMRRDSVNRSSLLEFLEYLEEEYFVDESIFSDLPAEDEILIAMKLSKIPEVRLTIGRIFTYDCLFALGTAGDHTTHPSESARQILDDSWDRLEVPGRLDLCNYLATFGFAVAKRRENDEALEAIFSFLEERKGDENEILFIRYAAIQSLQALGEAESKKKETPKNGRMSAELYTRRPEVLSQDEKEEDAFLRARIRPDANSYIETRMALVARDAVGMFDFSGIPQSIAEYRKVDVQVLRPEEALQELYFELFEDYVGDATLKGKSTKHGVNAVELLQQLYMPRMRFFLEENMGVPLNTLSLREQIQLLLFLVDTDPKTCSVAFQKIKSFGVPVARAFLSLEYGKGMGDKILSIAEVYDHVSAQKIFEKYAEIVDETEKTTEELLRKFFVKEEGKAVDRGKINDELLRRAKDIIVHFADIAEAKEGQQPSAEEVTVALDRFREDTVVFVSMFKAFAKGQTIEFNEIRGLEFSQRLPAEITREERKQMGDILQENWRSQIPSIADWVSEGFEKKLHSKNADTWFYILKKDNHVLGYVRFDERPDLGPSALYCGSLNVAPDFRGSAIGEAFLRNTIDHEATKHPIYADFFPEVRAGTAYVETFGSIVSGVEEIDIHGKKKKRLLVERRDDLNSRYKSRSKKYSREKLIEMAGQPPGRDKIVVRTFELPKEEEQFLDAVQRASERDIAMTRYFVDTKNPKIRYVAFEPRVFSVPSISKAA
ncbi:MAG: GNAT family N-acetyltransferase [bacterium]|nr:GNAT family N-acetyltransferase [bacterium]